MQRLQTRAQFQAVMDGRTVARTAHFVLHRQPVGDALQASLPCASPADGAAPQSWLGALLPKRWARRAVTRNALRRQIYSVAPEFEPLLGGHAHVVRLRAAFERAQFPSASSPALKQAARSELRQLFGALQPAGGSAA